MRAPPIHAALWLPFVLASACGTAGPDGGGGHEAGNTAAGTDASEGSGAATASGADASTLEGGGSVDGGPAGSDGGSDGGSSDDGGVHPVPGLIPDDRVTTWNPGILADDQLGLPLGDDGLPVRTEICASLSPGDDIQAALDACPEGSVVELAAGSFTVGATITLDHAVVLRGAGSQGAPSGTTIVRQGGGAALAIGTTRDQICYGGAGVALVSDAPLQSTTVNVGAAASEFAVGDLALVDQLDDAQVQQGDCSYFKRESGRSASQRVRIAAVDTDAGTLELDAPLHWDFRAGDPYHAEIVRVTAARTEWAGIEHLRIQGGTNPGYNGQEAGGIDVSNAAYCWVKDVQTDETIGGMHVALTATYRCVVRDGYFHHSADYGFGHDCYGIVLRCGAAENLIENNIARYMNKPIMLNVSGGGNVIGYNYADNSWADPPQWQEVNVDTHCAFPHMELIEGNFAPHMGATTTHGNAGYLTFFRNYASSQFAAPTVAGADVVQTGNVTALQFQGGDLGMNVVGNVLGSEGLDASYESYDGDNAVYRFDGGDGATDIAVTSAYRHGNYDFVNHDTLWDPSNDVHQLPESLYLEHRPAWWPSGTAWPWVGPDLDPMIGELPAKARADAM